MRRWNRFAPRSTVLLATMIAAIAPALAGGCGEERSQASSAVPRRPAHADPNDWCGEHALPESMCTKCSPSLTAAFRAAGDFCEEHGFPESVCPLCHPLAPPAGATGDLHDEERGGHDHEGEAHQERQEASSPIAPGTRIRFRSADIERSAGIETAPAREAALGDGIEVTARIDFDRNRLAEITAPVPGVVRELRVDLGETVARGAQLFVLESVAVSDLSTRLSAAQERARNATANEERQRRLLAERIASQRDVELATQERETAGGEVRAIEAALRMAGGSGTSGRVVLRAPIAGTVVRRPAVVGALTEASQSLATIADVSKMWALLDVREADASSVAVGQQVVVRVPGPTERALAGRITWMAPEVDPATRTVAARAEIENADGSLRANQFARALVQVGSPEGAVAVPREAVQRFGGASVVFVRTGAGVFEPRVVETGRSEGGLVHVRGAVRAGDSVVTTGAFLLKTELARDRIGAGCCEVEGPESGE